MYSFHVCTSYNEISQLNLLKEVCEAKRNIISRTISEYFGIRRLSWKPASKIATGENLEKLFNLIVPEPLFKKMIVIIPSS